MNILYRVNSNLPALAWIATVVKDQVNVVCGQKVEMYDNFWVEGAWSGEFLTADFDTAEWFCGTGAVIKGDSIVFVTPTGMHAGLYLLEDDEEIIVSNSLPFIMAVKGYDFDPKWPWYERFFNWNVLQGIYKYDSTVHAIRLCEGQEPKVDERIQMIMYRNITVAKSGKISIDIKKDTKGFDSFDEYYTRLVNTMKSLTLNAQDENRKVKYRVASFISSGYDAATCAAIAKETGAEYAMTFSAKGKYAADSGVSAAKHLGYKTIIERDADDYKLRNDFPETVTMAGGDIGTEISFCSFDEDMKDHLVYSGENGDFVWGKVEGYQTINDEIHIVWRNSEIGLWESHLHQEYIPVPMTSFGIRHWSDLFKISNSSEMQKWSVGGEYDRPIPRRILETKGLPRDSFGRKKYGAGFFYAFDWKKRILSRMSPKSASEFEKYMKQNHNKLPMKIYISYLWNYKVFYWNSICARFGIKMGIRIPDSKRERLNGITNPFAARYCIPWAGHHMVDEYKNKLRS